MRDDELASFKRLNLTEVAASFGYQLVPKKTTASSVFMHHRGTDDRIAVSMAPDGNFVFYSFSDTRQSGTVIDFVAHRIGAAGPGRDVNIGRARQELRRWTGTSRPSVPGSAYVQKIEPIEHDIAAVRARWEAMEPLEDGGHRWLNETRCLPPSLLAHPRFADRIRVDDRGNAVFPHLDRDGISGYEIKGTTTRFSKGGTKSLWASRAHRDDNTLVITESAIDALSYAALHGHDSTRFVSIGGQVSQQQLELARAAVEKLPGNPEDRGEVILAFDNDDAGNALAEKFTRLFRVAARPELTLHVHQPELGDCDWNDILVAETNRTPPPPEPA